MKSCDANVLKFKKKNENCALGLAQVHFLIARSFIGIGLPVFNGYLSKELPLRSLLNSLI